MGTEEYYEKHWGEYLDFVKDQGTEPDPKPYTDEELEELFNKEENKVD